MWGRRRSFAAATLVLMLSALIATGCASTRTVDLDSGMTDVEWADNIKAGDTVRGDTIGGEHFEFKVAVVEPGWIIGEGQRVRREDISKLEVSRRGFTKWFAESDIDGGGIAFTVVVGVLVALAFIAF
jgi:hypothetical protein